jgi:two-component system phosphate regulon sensor histidine kinase PhoR
MKRSIFLKIFGGYLIMSVGLTALILVFSFTVIRSYHLDTLANHLQNLGRSLKLTVIEYLEENNTDELDLFLKDFSREIDTRITVINREGVVLADSDEDLKVMDNHGFRPEIMTAYSGGIGQSIRFSNTVKEDMLYVAQPISREGQITDVIRVSLYVRDINYFLSSLRKNIWIFGVVIILISLVGALLFSRSLARPLQELSAASRRIAAGDFNTKVFLKKRDELSDLSESFNFMTEHIKSLFDELSRKKEHLNSILLSMEEGLMALDKDSKIFLTNRSFEKLTKAEDVEGKHFWEVIRDADLMELVEKVKTEKKNLTKEIELDSRFYLASATYIPSPEEMVITFHDITEIRNVEQVMKDFLVNVSHELRTPLTAIKGFVETLEAETDPKSKDYIEIVKRNTERLINIVDDLLIQSQLEEKYVKIEVEDVDIEQLIKNVLKIFDQNIREIGLTATLHKDETFPKKIKADFFKLEQMFINIIDNAVKYTEKGGITIYLKAQDQNIILEFLDTGIGIPQEELPRIFERFYVIDKSRSRKLGGTGLGLSIVKQIAVLHSGEVFIESTPGEGTKVTIKLPIIE